MQIQPSDLGLIARVTGLGKRYGHGAGSVTALDDVSLGLRRGEFTAIMGPSGSGKSTLMHIMAGLDSPTAGRAWLGDTDITELSDSALTVLRRRRVGFVFQAFNLVPTLDVRGNVLLPFELDGRRPSREEQAWIDELVDTLGLAARLRHRPHELSGGQQQRVAIARARVEVARGLVGEHEVGAGGEGTRDRHALLLAARELVRPVAQARGEPECVDELVDPGLLVAARPSTVELEREQHVAANVERRHQVERLEHEADPAP